MPRTAKLSTAFCLLVFATGGLAQAVTVLKGGTGKGSNPQTKLVGIDISILNNKTVPISFDNTFFSLTDAHRNIYESLSRLDHSFRVDLSPGFKVSERLWFEVPAELDPTTLKLSMHRPASKNWDDYLEITLANPVTASAPMWHIFHPGADTDSLTYAVRPPGKNYNDLTPPKLVHSPDPKFPPGAEDKIRRFAGRRAIVIIWLVIDTQGNPQQVELASAPVGMGLDTEAIRTVKQYRFKPALDKNGSVVAVDAQIEIIFNAP